MTKPEICYLTIGGNTDNALRGLEKSMRAEVIGREPYFYADLVAYPKVESGAVPAVRFPSGKKPVYPEDTPQDHWLPIDANGQGYWTYVHLNPESGRYESNAFNTTGTMTVSDGEQRLYLQIECNHFTLQDLESAIADFKCDLLKLVMQDSSIFIRSPRSDFSPLLTNETLGTIDNLIKAIEAVATGLKSRLSYGESKVAAHKAKPTAKGIREFAANPGIRQLSSRISVSNFDTGENRHVLSAAIGVERFLRLVSQLQYHWLDTVEEATSRETQDLICRIIAPKLRTELGQQLQYEHERMRSHLNIAAQIKKQNLNTATHQLQKLIATLRAKGISGTETSFNPMVFAQNSRYAKFQKAYASFTENQCFADLQFFTRFDAELTKISVTNIPNFYERWCLVKMIDLLVNRFRLSPTEPNWRKSFVKACLSNQHNIRVEFKRNSFECHAELTLIYQGEVTLGNRTYRPDFQIQTSAGTWVADAKFRTHSDNRTLMVLCNELATFKNYNMDEAAPVFIFHCAPYAGEETPQNKNNVWRRFCNYGSDRNNGRRGHVFITPESKYRNESLDNLVRWMLMIFQKLGRAQCPICGSTLVAEPGSGVGKLYRCSSCKFTSVQTHCHACHNPIWKNSCYWSYNLYADNWANVRCPNCGACLGEPKQHESQWLKFKKKKKPVKSGLDLYLEDPDRYAVDGELINRF